jgi:hypothetical protein
MALRSDLQLHYKDKRTQLTSLKMENHSFSGDNFSKANQTFLVTNQSLTLTLQISKKSLRSKRDVKPQTQI